MLKFFSTLFFKFRRIELSYAGLALYLSAYYALVINFPIYVEFYKILSSLSDFSMMFAISIPLFLFSIFNIIFNILSWPFLARPIFIILVITSSLVSYALYNYGIYFDYGMIENTFETDTSEALSYLSLYSILWVILTGIIPIVFIALIRIQPGVQLGKKVVALMLSILLLVIIGFFFYKDYSSVGRNNSYLKKMIIPTYYTYNTYKYIRDTYFSKPVRFKTIGDDAKLTVKSSDEKPTLFFFILGETARSQNYELNGYPRETNEYTHNQDVISFQNVHSCGTATAVSVPCMFSQQTRKDYNKKETYNQDNVMDILQRAGISLLWKENDGGDKGVAKRIPTTKVDRSKQDAFCDGNTCLDMALLQDLDPEIQSMKGDRMIVMHIMGSHGPTYYLRYPKDKIKFLPDCQRSDIENCSLEQTVNTYDNTIHYTDYVVSQAIEKLKSLENEYNTALIYMSDHGESLGENGLFLHGVPYALAPDYQTKVPLIMWMSDGFKKNKGIDEQCLKKEAESGEFSQDYIFSSLLGIMDVQTTAYDSQLDLYSKCR